MCGAGGGEERRLTRQSFSLIPLSSPLLFLQLSSQASWTFPLYKLP